MICIRFHFQSNPLNPVPPVVCVQALDVTVSQSSIQVARGQAAVLHCSFTTSAALNNLNIIWMVIPLSNANQPEQVRCSSTRTERSCRWTQQAQCGRFNSAHKVALIKCDAHRCWSVLFTLLLRCARYYWDASNLSFNDHHCIRIARMSALLPITNIAVEAGTQKLDSYQGVLRYTSKRT